MYNMTNIVIRKVNMKLLILAGILVSVFCSDYVQDDKIKGRRIVGGGNFGGFIGLNTYLAGPFLVRGKFEQDNYDISKVDNKGSNIDGKYDTGYVEQYREEKKDDDDQLEYLGYRGPRGCIEAFREKYKFDNNRNMNFTSPNLFTDEVIRKCDNFFGFTGPTANDEPYNLIRPCALDDWQCIRKYFAANSNCKPAYGPIPDPLYIDINTAYFPTANLTVALPNLMVRGLSSAKIREFYANKVSSNLVLALDVTNLNLFIPRAYFRFRRTAKESIVLADFATVTFRAATLTAVIPNIPKLRLDLADIHIDIQDSTPHIFGPGAVNSTDPDVAASVLDFNLFLLASIREGAFFQAQLFTAIYIQANICNFGLKLISV